MIKIVHLLPGRARLRLEAVKSQPELATRLHSHLISVSGIRRVEVNQRTGSLLLLYDPNALASADFLDAFSEAMGKLFPAHFAPGRLNLKIKRLQGKPELAQRIEKHLSPVSGIDHIEIDPATGNCLLVYDSAAVTSAGFLDSLSPPLTALLPKVDVVKLASRVGLRRR